MSAYAVVLLMIAFAAGVGGNAAGANSTSCTASSMTPQHSGSSQPLNTSPYSISLSASEYNHGSAVVVTLQGEEAFTGFFVLALPEDNVTGSAIGSFTETQSGDGTVISQDPCTGGTTNTTNFGTLNASNIELTWNAPTSGETPNITFYATFVQGYSVSYALTSPVLTFDPTITTTAATTSPAAASPATTSPAATSPAPTSPAATTTQGGTTISAGTTLQSTLALVVFSTWMWMMLNALQ